MASGHPTDKYSFMYQPDTHKSKNRLSSSMNPVYSPVQPGAPYGNPKNMAYTGYPGGYPTAAPTYTPNLYQTGSPGYPPEASKQSSTFLYDLHLPPGGSNGVLHKGYTTAGTPYKVPPTQMNGAPPPYSPSPNPYQTAMYPIRSAYPQQSMQSMQNLQNLYAQAASYYGQPVYAAQPYAYYTQPVYAAQPQPHVIHHTTVVQPNSLPSALYPAPVQAPRNNGMAAMGMVAGTTMAMSAGTLLTTPQHAQLGTHQHVTMPQYRPQGTPGYSYVPPHW